MNKRDRIVRSKRPASLAVPALPVVMIINVTDALFGLRALLAERAAERKTDAGRQGSEVTVHSGFDFGRE